MAREDGPRPTSGRLEEGKIKVNMVRQWVKCELITTCSFVSSIESRDE
jgi:hypothetical protein